MIESKRPIVYIGSREDLGAIPAIDKFFTDEIIKFEDGSKAQVLKRDVDGKENSQDSSSHFREEQRVRILAEKDGKPWAIYKGNLIIISRTPVVGENRNTSNPLFYIKDKWLIFISEDYCVRDKKRGSF